MGDRHVFLGNLCHVTSEELREYCEQYGLINDFQFNRDKEHNIYHCFAFVTFQSAESVKKFMSNRPHLIGNGLIFVKRALPRFIATIPERLVVTNRLVLENAKKFSRRKLEEHFRKFGNIRKFDYEKGFLDYEDYDPVDCVLLARPHFLETKEIFVTKKIPTVADVKKLSKNSLSSDSISPQTTFVHDDDDLMVKFKELEKQFDDYKIAKEKELAALRSELNQTKEELSDITQIKLDRLLKNQQVFQQNFSTYFAPTHAQLCDDFLRNVTRKKRRNEEKSSD